MSLTPALSRRVSELLGPLADHIKDASQDPSGVIYVRLEYIKSMAEWRQVNAEMMDRLSDFDVTYAGGFYKFSLGAGEAEPPQEIAFTTAANEPVNFPEKPEEQYAGKPVQMGIPKIDEKYNLPVAVVKPDILVTLSVAKQALTETRDFTTIINIRDMAVATKAWASARGADEAAMLAVEVKLHAERKAGEFLVDMKKEGILSDGKFKTVAQDVPPQTNLKNIGVDRIESQRWQRIAAIPESDFEDYLTNAKKRTQSALLALAGWRQHEETPLPAGVFDIILADPPWQYDFSSSARGNPERHYPTLSVEEIAKLPVPSSENAVLFMWATNPKLREALEVMSSWGFTYRTNMVWVKDKIGTGYYFREQHELLLVGVKGDGHPPQEGDRSSSVLEAPRREHSQKPDGVYALIESMYPNLKWIELFARKRREGWISWGNEIG